ncbi:hypothetical protein [Frankia sp. AgB1.8]|jgi:hypothetical protein
MHKLLVASLVAAGATVAAKSVYPDLHRYLEMRRM